MSKKFLIKESELEKIISTIVKTIIKESDDEKFSPTKEWMESKYNELNKRLFNNSLGQCILLPSMSRNTSKSLGCFHFGTDNLKIVVSNRRIFYQSYPGSEKIYINRNNFFELCKPTIELNSHYKALESSWMGTLVHEMCHYYTYSYGYAPLQSHGREFRSIAEHIAIVSNGEFNIQRLATAEEMKGFELDDKMTRRKNDRMNRKSLKMNILLGVEKNRKIRLITTTSQDLVNSILKLHSEANNLVYLGLFNDSALYQILNSKGYSKNFRTYRYYEISGDNPILDEFEKYKGENILYNNVSLKDAINFAKGGELSENKEELSEDVDIEDNIISISAEDELSLYSPFEKE